MEEYIANSTGVGVEIFPSGYGWPRLYRRMRAARSRVCACVCVRGTLKPKGGYEPDRL